MKKNQKMKEIMIINIILDNILFTYMFFMAGINNQCIGCGTCAAIAPEIFKVEGIPAQIIKPLTPTDKEQYDQAQSACPVAAIDNF